MSTPVAIVGMACLFAGAPDLRGFRDNIFAGVDSLGEAPPGWLPDSPSAARNPLVYTTRGGWLADPVTFDSLAYGVMPASVDGSEPEHFVALRLAAEALADAGYDERPFPRETTGVILGRGTYVNRAYVSVVQHTVGVDQTVDLLARLHPEWPTEELDRIGTALRDSLPPFTAETAPGLAHSVMCGRIANRLDLMGPAYSVDAACASSLIALELAMGELDSGRADLVLAGGVQVSTSFPIAALFCRLGALSRSGLLRPFDPRADGTLLGEGAGIVAVKRLADAERDGDRVYAVLRGIGSASDGRAMGILAPRVEGEELAMRRAYERAGVSPDAIGLLEAHGTGTVVGDSTELEALGRVWDGRRPPAGVAIGSVKSMIGHCIPAAGIAGIIKTALALHHRVLPPTLHSAGATPRLAGTPFHLDDTTRPWVHAPEQPRRAAVSAFGFGGIDAHAVLEEHVASAAPTRTRCGDPTELFVVAAADRAGLRACLDELRAAASTDPQPELRELARRFPARSPEPDEARAVLVSDSTADLVGKLTDLALRLADPGCSHVFERRGVYFTDVGLLEQGKVAFVFPGEGAQHPGMLADLCRELPATRHWFDLLDAALPDSPVAPSRLVFGADADSEPLLDLGLSVLSVYAADRAALAALDILGIRPDLVSGHSSGEYAALVAAGATPDGSSLDLLAQMRTAAALTAQAQADGIVPLAGLLAVGAAPPGLLDRVLVAEPDVRLALDNCPNQSILCGSGPALERVAGSLTAAGAICRPLPFGRAYHTPAFRPMAERLAGFYDGIEFCSPAIPIYSCLTAAPMPAEPERIRVLALAQWSRTVRFRETVEAMHAAGARVFVEVGPGDMLTGMVRDTLGRREHLVVGLESRGRSGIAQLHHLVAQLIAHGAGVCLDALRPEPVSEPTRAARPLALNLALPLLDGADALPAPDPGPGPETAAPSRPERRGPTADFPGAMRRFLDVERSVVSAALRAGPPPTPPPPADLLRDAHVVRRSDERVELSLDLVADDVDFLDDHRLGPVVSARPDVRPLAVLPLAVALELMVGAAARLGTPRGAVGLTDVRASRWVTFPVGRARLRITAERIGPGVRTVRLWQDDSAEPSVTAVVTFGMRASRPGGEPAPDGGTRPCRWRGDELYAEGATHGMFHGPTLRTVADVDRVSPAGAEAWLEPPSASSLAEGTRTSPLLVDAAGQVLGYWAADSLRDRFVIFPTSIDTLTVSEGPRSARARCQVRVAEVAEDHVRADLDVRGSGTEVRARGWTARRVTLDEEFYRFRLDPRGRHLSVPLSLPEVDVRLGTARVELPPGFLEAEGGLWRDVLAHLVLGGEERRDWADRDVRRGRLAGRVAAKDAVRRLLVGLGGGRPYPADVQVHHDDLGRPLVSCPGEPAVLVSVSYAGDVAVAVCAAADGIRGLGVDVARRRGIADLAAAAFTAEELRVLDRAPAEHRDALGLGLWCAKEAAVKAVGMGFAALGGPQRVVTSPVPESPGRVLVQLPDGAGPDLLADTWLVGDLVHAVVLARSVPPGAEPAEHRVDQQHVLGKAHQVGDELAHPLG